MDTDQNAHIARDDDLSARLSELRPAKATLDPSTVFYRAGYQAGQAEASHRLGRPLGLLAAGLLAAAVAAPAAYLAGQSSVAGQFASLTDRSALALADGGNDRAAGRDHVTATLTDRDPLDEQSRLNEMPDNMHAKSDAWFDRGVAKMQLMLASGLSYKADSERDDDGRQSLAAFHSFVSTQQLDTGRWPEIFERESARVENQSQALTRDTAEPSSHVIAVGDAHDITVMMEPLR